MNYYYRAYCEPVLLFLVFFFPGYLAQQNSFDGGLFNEPAFNIFYTITVLPQILLIIYILELKKGKSKTRYGLIPLRKEHLLPIIFTFLGIFLVITPVALLGAAGGTTGPGWRLDVPGVIPLVFITCMVTGYSEELFFRAYLLTELQPGPPPEQQTWPLTELPSEPQPEQQLSKKQFPMGRQEVAAALGTSLLFGAGHWYQGPAGFLGTFAIGMFLCFIFFKYRNLHIIAIAHGLYNFTVLLLSMLVTLP